MPTYDYVVNTYFYVPSHLANSYRPAIVATLGVRHTAIASTPGKFASRALSDHATTG
jgi:hypothetical protein